MTTIGSIILIASLLIIGFVYFFIIQPHMEIFNRLKDDQKYHNDTYLSKSGGTSLYFPPSWNKIRDGKTFNYSLRSFDGGKNWFAIDREKLFDEVVVLGLVDHVYPGLMDHLDDIDRLTKRVSENGSLDPTDSSDIKALTDAGFIVL